MYNIDSEHQPARLLFVDDENNVLKSLRRLFRGGDYQVHLANNGLEGLQILEQQQIDLVISDMRMPEMDGAQFLQRVAERWPQVIRILLTGFADLESTISAVNKGRIYSYCQKPWDDEELKDIVGRGLLQKRLLEERERLFEIINRQNDQLKELNSQLESEVEQRTMQLEESYRYLDHAHKMLKKQYTDTIKTFSRIIEMRPGIKSGHAKYIAEVALKVADHLKIKEEDRKHILYAGLLLQIGKIGLDESLLNQPFYSMTSTERELFLAHALEGEALLKNMIPLQVAATMIRHQFEHYDGSGYPQGLIAEQISLGARILAVVRDYVAYLDGSMTGHSMTVADVISRLLNKKDSFYDPRVVEAFLEVLAQMEEQAVRPVVEISWTKLEPGMEVEEIRYEGRLFLKDCILDKGKIYEIVALRERVGDKLEIRVRLGNASDEKR
ncbi:HD domain-containing phosphohydrolase [Methylomarinum vadi]|uniref:HD domain-containing phosphohydrolase n=1 Tax=Methylomarinum vadi TaxID=438855 RepID=UPI0004DFB1DC|nr:HD domain-containing phosphohydrolase [Methylomarinum vadi]